MAGRRMIGTKTVGRTLAHDSAELHVQGAAAFIDDLREPEGLVHVYPGFAGDGALGRITTVDLSAVLAAPGVIRVLTAKDVPGLNDCAPVFGGDPILADGRIMFHGQVIFAVVAATRGAARRAARLARIGIAAETPAVTVEDALAAKTIDVGEPYRFLRGDPAKRIAAAKHSVSESFRIGGQEHFYLEGQASLAVPEEHDAVTVHCSTQHPSEVQHIVAHMLHVPAALVTVECRRMGGAFGGKESQAAQWACLAALAARLTGRPAKCRLDRDEDMMLTGKRHDFRVDYRAGFDAKGRVSAVEVDFLARCGCSADLSNAICDRTMFHADNAYFYPAARIATRRLRTNTVSNTAFRGFGGPQGMLFAERLMEVIAIRTGQDPLDVRKANLYGVKGSVTPYGMKVADNIAPGIIAELEKSSGYRARRLKIARFNARNPVLKKGISLTPVKFGISFTLTHLNQAGALVHVYTDGSVHLNHGGTEMGQGLYTKVAQVVAEEFGISAAAVRITATTTGKVPNTSATAASSGADLNGMAARAAASTIKNRLIDFAARQWKAPKSRIRFEDGRVLIGNRAIAFGELARQAHIARVPLSSTGYYATPKIHWDRARGKGRPFFYFAYGAACSEVTIDTLTGELKVERVDILHDAGRSLNPGLDIGQVEGGFVQGMGWLTTEELVFDDQGRLRTHAPSTYKIPCASDVPADFRVKLFESPGNREDTIHRSKAVGEPPLMLGISVWTAIFDAVASLKPGAVPRLDAPATPEAILRAVKGMTA
ncbi:xanthine dehydrogenase molybdopterin binding subunit [Aestuariivirga sp.]|uniref:xanthine dehydrogenase molybdopterin binding subunit n=1 Tax=Aestuariivirga sp. TaxID=2650926 RepID=UPI0025C469EF|nr:xanthine dehydrogenase molybdopterin binding subunit [Aestuariivirga sp.]MCA3556509.1 xanthine dehydrogenase molybdopterin binding subunit [Aestuariivirga sp.]